MTKNNFFILAGIVLLIVFFIFKYQVSYSQIQSQGILTKNIFFVQINNLRIYKIVQSNSDIGRFLILAVRDAGWRCLRFAYEESLTGLNCNLNLRRLIINKGVSIKINEKTQLLFRDRQKADITSFKENDKINVYGRMNLKDGIMEALIVRNLSRQSLPISSPSPVIPTSTTPTPTLDSIEGFLKKQGSSIYMWGSYVLTTKDGKTYLVKADNLKVENLLSDLADKNVLVRIYGDIKYQDLEGGFWSIIAKRVEEIKDKNGSQKNPQCFVGGCSAHICSSDPFVITTCEWKPEYACYRNARCEIQKDGNCGWTITPEVEQCLQKAQNTR